MLSPPDDEQLRKSLGYGPRNYKLPYSKYSLGTWMRFFFSKKNTQSYRRKTEFYNHITAKEVKKLVGERVWNEYYKFCFERNPWDRVISQYYHLNKKGSRQKISDFIDSGKIKGLKNAGYKLYTIDGKIAVDKIYLYEELDKALDEINNRFGFREKIVLPRAKSDTRKDKRHYSKVLDSVEREKIARYFSNEIEIFGYEY